MSSGLGRIKNYPLSDSDIRKILGRDIKIMTYPQLKNLTDYRQAFDKKGRCILLYLTMSDTAGHWVCLLNKQGHIEYFDPYGEKPETPLHEVPRDEREEYGEEAPFLTEFLKASGKPVYYNTYPFQKEKEDVNTCGRHAIVRCLYAPKSLEQYKKAIDSSGMSPDDFVSALTAQKLGK
jgi:hypothetical protein